MLLSELLGRTVIPQSMNRDVTGITTDSREVKPGYVFAALQGSLSDGRIYIDGAVKKGAVAILTDNTFEDQNCSVFCLKVDNPRQKLAHLSQRFFGDMPEMIVAVTGTNGKTSVAHFVRSIWQALGNNSASLGTLGIVTKEGTDPLHYTSPEPVLLHRMLSELKDKGITHVALEASSHGLDQFRMDATKVKVGAFTNLTRDHLDYHENSDAYLAAKLGLVSRVVEDGGTVVLNADSEVFPQFKAAALKRDLKVIGYGRAANDLHLISACSYGAGQQVKAKIFGTKCVLDLPVAGEFQAMNILCAIGMVVASGAGLNDVMDVLPMLESVPGRMEYVAKLSNDASVYVDFAHTPDALETVLTALRPHTTGKLYAVIGCGGDRDTGKRPVMGKIAAAIADAVYVTDDNPRTEDASEIRAEIMAACPDAIEIGDRKSAIEAAMKAAKSGDIVLVAGKGHESGQIIGTEVIPFNDKDVVLQIIKAWEGQE